MLLCSIAIETKDSTRDNVFQGTNNVAVDFHSQASKTSKIVSSGVSWTWKPEGPEKNAIKSEPIIYLFPNDSGSGDFHEEDPANETQNLDKIWNLNVTIQEVVYNTPSPVTLDTKRNKTEEKVHLVYEGHLRKTNWCFKDIGHTKPIYKVQPL